MITAVLAGALALGGLPHAARAETVSIDPGPPEVVYDKAQQMVLCPTTARNYTQYPDHPAHAFRDSLGRVQLNISHEKSVRMLFPTSLDDLGAVEPPYDCSTVAIFPQPTVSVAHDHDPYQTNPPSYFDHNEWLASPYTFDGETIHALVHNEFHGHLYAGESPNPYCTSTEKLNCWQNAITTATSTDGGATYTHPEPSPAAAPNLIGTLPYAMQRDWGAHGYAGPSNIVFNDQDGSPGGHYYAMFTARGNYPGALGYQEPGYEEQQFGACLMRTDAIPGTWRMWTGEDRGQPGLDDADFTDFADPYRSTDPALRNHRCQPIPGVAGTRGLTFNTHLQKWMATWSMGTGGIFGFHYSLSGDLLNWTRPKLLMQSDLDPNCPGTKNASYPSILDPDDALAGSPGATGTARNFDHPGATPYLYFTYDPLDANCARPGNASRLVRVRLTISGTPDPPAKQLFPIGSSTAVRINFEPHSSRFRRLNADGTSAWGQLSGYDCAVAVSTDRRGCVDVGSPYQDLRGFGWVQNSVGVPASQQRPLNLTPNAVDRGHPTSQYARNIDTFMYMQYAGTSPARIATPGAWEIAMEPGRSYNVKVSVGDPNYQTDSPATSAHSIRVEGRDAITRWSPTSNRRSRNATVCVTPTDGEITIVPGAGSTLGTNTKINYVEITTTTGC